MSKPLQIIVFYALLTACTQSQEQEQKKMEAQLFYKIEAELGEGPIWNHQSSTLYWVDIEGKFLHILDPSTGANISFPTPSRIGTVVPLDDGSAILALQDGVYMFQKGTGEISLLSYIDSENTQTRLNDGKCDPAGRLWVGTMHMPQDKTDGNLYMVDSLGKVTLTLDSITISNGIVWSSDASTMYYIDTPTATIRAFDFSLSSGEITNERVVVNVDERDGYPDGMAIDEENKLWVGLWNGGAIARYDPKTGELMRKISVPAHNVTACAFGGRNLDSLFITTARTDMTPEELEKYPDAGSVFVVNPGVKGVQSDFFKLASD